MPIHVQERTRHSNMLVVLLIEYTVFCSLDFYSNHYTFIMILYQIAHELINVNPNHIGGEYFAMRREN